MKIIAILCSLILAASAFGLTPDERKTAEHAKNELVLTQKALAVARQETQAAEGDAQAAQASADLANQKADSAVRSINEDMRKFKGHWGINAIVFGVKELVGHIIILAIVLVGIGVLITIFVPAARPILGIAGSFLGGLWRRILGMIRKKDG